MTEDTAPGITDEEMLTTALLVLVEFGIEPDIQELLIYGNPARRVRPGALKAAMRAVASRTRQATTYRDEEGNLHTAEQLAELLHDRDAFLVSKGLFTEYAAHAGTYRTRPSAPARDGITVADYEVWAEDVRSLTLRLDIALNGDGAAKGPSLCDVVGQVEDIARKSGPIFRTPAPDAMAVGDSQQRAFIQGMKYASEIAREADDVPEEYRCSVAGQINEMIQWRIARHTGEK